MDRSPGLGDAGFWEHYAFEICSFARIAAGSAHLQATASSCFAVAAGSTRAAIVTEVVFLLARYYLSDSLPHISATRKTSYLQLY